MEEIPITIPALGHYPEQRVLMGTTLIAVEYGEGVVVGTDSRTSRGSFIASRATDKITPLTDNIVVCRSGSAADTQAISDIVKFYVELYGLTESKEIGVYRTAQLFRKFLFDYRESLTASVIIAGFDELEGGQIYAIPLGGYTIRQNFAANGSGSTFVTGYLDKQWKPNLTLKETKNLVQTAVFLATYRDGSSGGVIRLATINKTGTKRELILPNQFPQVESPMSYSMFPAHCSLKLKNRKSSFNTSTPEKYLQFSTQPIKEDNIGCRDGEESKEIIYANISVKNK